MGALYASQGGDAIMALIERVEPERPHKDDPPCTCGSTAVIDANRHDWRCARRLWIERNDARGAVHLTDAERERMLWWLHQPVPPGPMKDLDVAIIRKLTARGGR